MKTLFLYLNVCLRVRLDSLLFHLYGSDLPFGLFWADHWVLVTVITAQTHRAVHCVPGWRIREPPSMGRFQVAIAWQRTIVGNVFGDCHAPCPLNISVVDFEKEYTHFSHFKWLNCLSLLHTLSVAVKSPWLGGPILFSSSLFTFCGFYILLNLFSSWI
jgi:hypothetical protein